jgi:hypothetical protein
MQFPHPNKTRTFYDGDTATLHHDGKRYTQTHPIRGLDIPTLVWECRNNQFTPPGYRIVWNACDAGPSLRPLIYDRITFSESSRPQQTSGKVRVSISLGVFASRRDAEKTVEAVKTQIHELGAALAFADALQ